ncbi:MAG: putative glycoside hydrolase [Gemmatimonadetes bacterium]|nr:putative glycoside hydrolase [Gemmatimonadota bacterium]
MRSLPPAPLRRSTHFRSLRGNPLAILVLALTAALGACESPDARVESAYASDGEQVDSAEIARLKAEQARADSVAEWKARFGNRIPKPDSIRGLYVNGWAAGSRSRMAELIRVAKETEINAFVIDIKESDTYLVYDSTGIALALEIGADQRPGSRWLPELIRTLQEEGIYPIARIVVFKDRVLAEKRPDLAIRHTGGGVWKDQKGKPWVDPYSRTVWDYNIDIAREALDMGFSEIQWDYVRFPDVTATLQRTMAFADAGGKSRQDNIRDFIAYSQEQLAEYQVPITADVFGLVTHLEGDVGIGQQWEKLIQVSDALLPMVYPSHYYAGSYGFGRPVSNPYEIVRMAITDAVERTEHLASQGATVGEVVPWLEAMTASWLRPTVEYGPSHLRGQIQATYDAGAKSWVLWNPGSRYQVFYPAFRDADGSPSQLERNGWTAPRYEVPRARLSAAIRKRDAAERAARIAADSAFRANSVPAPTVATQAGGIE